jgi:hypothetical protein
MVFELRLSTCAKPTLGLIEVTRPLTSSRQSPLRLHVAAALVCCSAGFADSARRARGDAQQF